MIADFLANFGRNCLIFLHHLGVSGLFFLRIVFCKPRIIRLFPLVIEQIYNVGVLSLIIMVISSLFIGMVLALQGYDILQKFGSVAQLGRLVALSVVRELGPVIGGLLFAGRAGSALTSEIGLMQATEQIDSMEIMAVNPIWRVVAPRFWAGMISMPILIAIFCIVAVFGGYLVGVKWLGVDPGQYWSCMQASVDFHADIINGLIKGLVFGIFATWIAIYQGYYSVPNSLGISRATTKTVVYSSLTILGLDFVLTSFMMGGW